MKCLEQWVPSGIKPLTDSAHRCPIKLSLLVGDTFSLNTLVGKTAFTILVMETRFMAVKTSFIVKHDAKKKTFAIWFLSQWVSFPKSNGKWMYQRQIYYKCL